VFVILTWVPSEVIVLCKPLATKTNEFFVVVWMNLLLFYALQCWYSYLIPCYLQRCGLSDIMLFLCMFAYILVAYKSFSWNVLFHKLVQETKIVYCSISFICGMWFDRGMVDPHMEYLWSPCRLWVWTLICEGKDIQVAKLCIQPSVVMHCPRKGAAPA
jgi:hypothetical protein